MLSIASLASPRNDSSKFQLKSMLPEQGTIDCKDLNRENTYLGNGLTDCADIMCVVRGQLAMRFTHHRS